MKTGKSCIFMRINSSCYFVKQANISVIIIKSNAIPYCCGMAFFMLSYFQGNTAQSPPDGFALNLRTYSAQVLCGVALILTVYFFIKFILAACTCYVYRVIACEASAAVSAFSIDQLSQRLNREICK